VRFIPLQGRGHLVQEKGIPALAVVFFSFLDLVAFVACEMGASCVERQKRVGWMLRAPFVLMLNFDHKVHSGEPPNKTALLQRFPTLVPSLFLLYSPFEMRSRFRVVLSKRGAALSAAMFFRLVL